MMVVRVNVSLCCEPTVLTEGSAFCSWVTSKPHRLELMILKQMFHPARSLWSSVYYGYSRHILRARIDFNNGSMTHFIHANRHLSAAHCGCRAVRAQPPTDPRWWGIYGAVIRTTDSAREPGASHWTNRALCVPDGQQTVIYYHKLHILIAS